MAKTLYDVLGVQPGVSHDEIKIAYRRKVMFWHPDRNGGSETSTQRFREIQDAYDTLTNQEARRRYDETLARSSSQAMLSTSSFWNNTMELAFFLAERGVGQVILGQELTRRGCPATISVAIAQAITTQGQRSRLSRLSKLASASRRPFASVGRHSLDLGLLIKRAVLLLLFAVLAAAWVCAPRPVGKLQQAMLSDHDEMALEYGGK